MDNNYSNLTITRAEVDAWEPRGRNRRMDQHAAMSLVAMAGVSLLLCGVTRSPSSSRWWIAGGAGLLGCAAAGLGLGQWFEGRRWRSDERSADVVTLESMGSFPASDPPSSNATTASSPSPRG